jgi:hypothetical protein
MQGRVGGRGADAEGGGEGRGRAARRGWRGRGAVGRAGARAEPLKRAPAPGRAAHRKRGSTTTGHGGRSPNASCAVISARDSGDTTSSWAGGGAGPEAGAGAGVGARQRFVARPGRRGPAHGPMPPCACCARPAATAHLGLRRERARGARLGGRAARAGGREHGVKHHGVPEAGLPVPGARARQVHVHLSGAVPHEVQDLGREGGERGAGVSGGAAPGARRCARRGVPCRRAPARRHRRCSRGRPSRRSTPWPASGPQRRPRAALGRGQARSVAGFGGRGGVVVAERGF